MMRDEDGLAPARGVINGLALSLVLWAFLAALLREVLLWLRG